MERVLDEADAAEEKKKSCSVGGRGVIYTDLVRLVCPPEPEISASRGVCWDGGGRRGRG